MGSPFEDYLNQFFTTHDIPDRKRGAAQDIIPPRVLHIYTRRKEKHTWRTGEGLMGGREGKLRGVGCLPPKKDGAS